MRCLLVPKIEGGKIELEEICDDPFLSKTIEEATIVVDEIIKISG